MTCVFCKRDVPTRGHHLIPRCKGGTEIVPTCESCENFIHGNWSHLELRDNYNTVDKILNSDKFIKFSAWLLKQNELIVFKTCKNRSRTKNKYK